ncbi:MAG: hypothetical protein ACYDGR_11865 [Candidatus Dormibacteria bacterium]
MPRGSRPGPRGARVRRLDLHGYDVLTATELANLTVREAYQNGYQAVELLHGAADVVEPVKGGEGRGGIKWELRRMLDEGRFDEFCRSRQDHQLLEGMLRLMLRNNPQPRSESWSAMPPRNRG